MARRIVRPEPSLPEFVPLTLPTQPVFNLADIARLFGKRITTVHYWLLSGRIREATRTSERGGWRVPRQEVIRLVSEAGIEIPGLWSRPQGVLVVDDDAGVRTFIDSLFRGRAIPLELSLAADAKEGFRLAKERTPAVVVLDYWYGAKSGPDPALAFMAKLKNVGNPKVIGVSGDAAVGPKMRAAGALEFLAKPIKAKIFIDTIMKFARGERRREVERRRPYRGMIEDTAAS